MAQGVLPFQYEAEVRQEGITARAGLGIFLDLFQACGLRELTGRVLPGRGDQGFTDFQVLSSLILLNLAGGECVADLDVLEGDAGLCRLFRQAEVHGVGRKGRREVSGRFRRGRERTFPSASALFRWLFSFHDPGQEHRREPGRSFVPLANARLRGLSRLNAKLIAFAQTNSVEPVATLDLDATLIETNKREAFFCYQGFPAYSLLTFIGANRSLCCTLKNDLAGGRLPSEDFGENAAWWLVTVMAFNFFVMMKRLGLGAAWAAKKLKAVRFLLLNLPARVASGARRLKVRLCRGHPSLDALIRAWARILALAP